jgi:hypothetical protein
MAEFLVHEAVPLELISGVAVINPQIRKFVASLATEHRCETAVAIRPNWYF